MGSYVRGQWEAVGGYRKLWETMSEGYGKLLWVMEEAI